MISYFRLDDEAKDKIIEICFFASFSTQTIIIHCLEQIKHDYLLKSNIFHRKSASF